MIVLKRYIYKNGLDLIAPAKCGTRWLETADLDNRISIQRIYLRELENHITPNTTFVFRPVREHFESALNTDMFTHSNDLDMVLNEFETSESSHWSPYLYKMVYNVWIKINFRLIKLAKLSDLFPNTIQNNFNSDTYKFDKIDIIQSDRIDKLYKWGDVDSKYLERMLSVQYSKYDWSDYSKLEDDNLRLRIENNIIKDENDSYISTIKKLFSKIGQYESNIHNLKLKNKELSVAFETLKHKKLI